VAGWEAAGGRASESGTFVLYKCKRGTFVLYKGKIYTLYFASVYNLHL
jgi:hypothetical protein